MHVNNPTKTQRPSKVSEPIIEAKRSYAIDVFRAVTMLLMIFVNDLWTLEGYPNWLGHAAVGEDRLGFSDVIFPAFLFIVGLSIPFALQNRFRKRIPKIKLAEHIILRGLALLVMGIFHVNLESYAAQAPLTKPVWQLLITAGFFLIWMDYPLGWRKVAKRGLRGIGIGLLVIMAFLYRGGTEANLSGMKFHWYGILGLIGWAYLICALIFLFTKGNLLKQWMAFLFFMAFNSLESLGLLEFLEPVKPYVWIVGNGAMPAFTMAGVVVSLYYQRWFLQGQSRRFAQFVTGFSGVMLGYGIATRPLWGIHKIGDSPSWVAICLTISVAAFGFFIWLVDIKGKKAWFSWLKPAGTSTLTCYLIPYVHYALYVMVGVQLPDVLRTGHLGILKCLGYALAIVLLTGLLERKQIRLKL